MSELTDLGTLSSVTRQESGHPSNETYRREPATGLVRRTGHVTKNATSPTRLAFLTLFASHSVASADYVQDHTERVLVDISTSRLRPASFRALTEQSMTERRELNLRLAEMVGTWLDDDSQNDEVLGPLLDRELRDNPLRFST